MTMILHKHRINSNKHNHNLNGSSRFRRAEGFEGPFAFCPNEDMITDTKQEVEEANHAAKMQTGLLAVTMRLKCENKGERPCAQQF